MSKTRKSPAKIPSALRVSLAAVPNLDFGPGSRQGTLRIAQRWEVARDLRDASRIVRRFIEENDLGGGNFVGGEVIDPHGKFIAHISYNGRIWDKRPGDSSAREIVPNPASPETMRQKKALRDMIMQVRGGKMVFLGETPDGRGISVGPYQTAVGPENQYAVFYGNVPYRMGTASESVGLFLALADPSTVRPAPSYRANPAEEARQEVTAQGVYVIDAKLFEAATKLLKPLEKSMRWSFQSGAPSCAIEAGPTGIMLTMMGSHHAIRLHVPGRVIGTPPALFFALGEMANVPLTGRIELSIVKTITHRKHKDYSGKEHEAHDTRIDAKLKSSEAEFALPAAEPPDTKGWFAAEVPLKVASVPAPVLEQMLHAVKFVPDMLDPKRQVDYAGITISVQGAGLPTCEVAMTATNGSMVARSWSSSCSALQAFSARIADNAPACLAVLAKADGDSDVELFSVRGRKTPQYRQDKPEETEHPGLLIRRKLDDGLLCELVSLEEPGATHLGRWMKLYLCGGQIAGEVIVAREPLAGAYDRCAQLRECWEDAGWTSLRSSDGFLWVGLEKSPPDSWTQIPATTRGHNLDAVPYNPDLLAPALARLTSENVILDYYLLESLDNGNPLTASSRETMIQVRGSASPYVNVCYGIMNIGVRGTKDELPEGASPVSGPAIERAPLPATLAWSASAAKISRPKKAAPPPGEPKADVMMPAAAIDTALRLLKPVVDDQRYTKSLIVTWTESVLTVGAKRIVSSLVDGGYEDKNAEHRYEAAVTIVTVPCRSRRPAEGQYLIDQYERFVCSLAKIKGDWGLRVRGNALDLVTTDLPAIPAIGHHVDPATAPENVLRKPPSGGKLGQTLAEPTCAAVEAVYPYMSQDATRAHLNSILLTSEDGALALVATDGHRMAKANTAMPFEVPSEILIGADMADAITALCKYKPGSLAWSWSRKERVTVLKGTTTGTGRWGSPEKVAQSDSREDFASLCVEADFQTAAGPGHVLIFTERQRAMFPAYNQVIPSSHQWTLGFDRKAMIAAVTKATKIVGEKNAGVAFDVSSDNASIDLSARRMSGATERKAKLSVPGSGTGYFKAFGVNGKYLVEGMERLTSNEVSISGSDPLDPLLLRGKFTPYVQLTSVVMPMRGDGPDKEQPRPLEGLVPKPVSRPHLPAPPKPPKARKGKAAAKPPSKPKSTAKPASLPARPPSPKPPSKPKSAPTAPLSVRFEAPRFVLLNELHKLIRRNETQMRVARDNTIYVRDRTYKDPNTYDVMFRVLAPGGVPLPETGWYKFDAEHWIKMLEEPERRRHKAWITLVDAVAFLEFEPTEAQEVRLRFAATDEPASAELNQMVLRVLGNLEGTAWMVRQNADKRPLHDPHSFWTNLAAWQALMQEGDVVRQMLKSKPMDLVMSLVYPDTGFIDGEKLRTYVVMPDGELVLLAESAPPSFQERARRVMRVL